MGGLICLFLLYLSVQAHTNKLQDDADLESSLMPQELNPSFIGVKDEPWKAVIPTLRLRRDLSQEPATVSVAATLKKYSRVAAFVVLVLSAIVEVVLYTLDFYVT